MNITRRRINLAQAWTIAEREWATTSDLAAAGAYGSPRMIHRGLLRMNAEGLVDIRPKPEGRGFLYRFTHDGLNRMGLVPARRET